MKGPDPRKSGMWIATTAVAGGLIVVVGCGNEVKGNASANAADATAYRADAASSSAAATSSRKAAATAKAVADNCSEFPITTSVGVIKFNDFIQAHGNDASDVDRKKNDAIAALQDAAKTVETGVNDADGLLPPDIRSKFTEYVDGARALGDQVGRLQADSAVGPINDASRRVQNARMAVQDACPK